MTERDLFTNTYNQAELMRMADMQRAKYLKALAKRIWAGVTAPKAGKLPQLGGAKA